MLKVLGLLNSDAKVHVDHYPHSYRYISTCNQYIIIHASSKAVHLFIPKQHV